MLKKVLLTGGAGYIGSHTAKALYQNGYEVITIDNLVYGHEEFVNWGPWEKVDLLDFTQLNRIIEKYSPIHAIIHFAAFIDVGESVVRPEKYYRNNIVGSLNLFESALKFHIPYIIFSSSCAVYGEPREMPISENHPLLPINPYGFTKLAIERMLNDFDGAYNIRSVALRYFNAAGADPEPLTGQEIGEDHAPETHLIPLIFQAALGKRDFIGIFGNDYETGDGTAIRDYIHITDIASAHLLALKYLEKGGSTDFFNLGNGKGHSVREVIYKAKKIIGKKFDFLIKEMPRRAGDSPCLVSKSDKIQSVLNWKPKYSSLEQIIAHAWKWHLYRFG